MERLRGRRILQGKRTLFIVPKALHIYLWIDYWNNYGRGFDFQTFFECMPSQLYHWFLQLFIYAHASPVACNVVSNILSLSGPFSRREFLVSQAGTRFLDYLAEADPAATLGVLERTFGTWPHSDLKQWTTGRQNIVWALEKIAIWREHFLRAANVLVKFALAENSKNSNNSTGILHSLFIIGRGWSPTQAPPQERFFIIRELLESSDSARKSLGLELCKEWLNTHGGFRVIGADFQGLRPEIEFWRPKTWGDVFDAWRLVWQYLFSISRIWEEPNRRLANKALVEAGFQLLYFGNIAIEIMETIFHLADDPATDIKHLTHMIIQTLTFRTEKLPRGILVRLRKLDKKITGESFWERFSRYVLNITWDEDHIIRNSEIKQSKLPSRRVKILAKEVAGNPDLFYKYLPNFLTVEGHRLFEFGWNIANESHSTEIVEVIIETQLCSSPERRTQFIGGYLSGLRSFDFEIWESTVLHLLENETSREVGLQIIFQSELTPAIVNRLLKLYREGKAKSNRFSHLWLKAGHDAIPSVLVEEIIATLTELPDETALKMAIELADYFFFKNQPGSCDESILFNLLTAEGFFCGTLEGTAGYHWHSVAKGFRERFPERDLELFAVIMSRIGDLPGLRSVSYPNRIADDIAKDHPDEAWAMVSSLLEEDTSKCYWIIAWLSDEIGFEGSAGSGAIRFFKPEVIMAWVLHDFKRRIRKLLRCLPKTLDEEEGGKLTRCFLDQFGNDEDFSDDLMLHFRCGGWSGSEVEYLSSKRDRARQWISEIKSGKIRSWLSRYIDYLNRHIVDAEIREEREF